jgi:hypothetical protein
MTLLMYDGYARKRNLIMEQGQILQMIVTENVAGEIIAQ